MNVHIPALALATTSAWVIAIASIEGVSGLVLPWWLGSTLAATSALAAWAIDGRRPGREPRVRLIAWILYLALLVGASAWYVDVRERLLILELWLPTLAVLLVLSPLFRPSDLALRSRSPRAVDRGN